MSQRSRVIQLYKTLQYLGREYPVNPEKMRATCKKVFKNNAKETNAEKIEEMIAKGNYFYRLLVCLTYITEFNYLWFSGDYVVKEIETLYALKKYRAMKKRYYDWKRDFCNWVGIRAGHLWISQIVE